MSHASWFVHGTSIVAEGPWGLEDRLGMPQGWGRTFRGTRGASVWFHAAIATPTERSEGALHEIEAAVSQVSVVLRLDPDVVLTGLHVWDGPRPYHFSWPEIRGTREVPDARRYDFNLPPSLPVLAYGVGISINIEFWVAGTVTFSAAGVRLARR
jgi:hypothetical protein